MTDDFDPWAEPKAAELTPAIVTPPPVEANTLFQAPRLGIIHLIAWTAVAAVLFKLDVAMEQFITGSSIGPAVFQATMAVVHQVSLAAQLVAFVVLLRAGALRRLGRLQPGHWLVLIHASFNVLYQVLWRATVLATVLLDLESRSEVYRTMGIVRLGIVLAECIAFFLAAYFLRRQKPWRSICVVAGVFALLSTYTMSVAYLVGLSVAVALAGLRLLVWLVAMLVELVRYRGRDWVHWLGIATAIIGGVLNIVWLVAIYLVINQS